MSPASDADLDAAALEALLDLSPDAVWFAGADGAVTRSNAAYARWRQSAATASETLDAMRLRALAGRRVMADVHLTVAGIERTFVVQAARVSGDSVVFTAREIGEAAALSSDAALERALLHLFTTEESLADVLPKALEFLCTSDSWDAALIWSPFDDELRPIAWWFSSEASDLEARAPSLRFRRGHGIPGRAFTGREIIRITDIYEESVLQRADLVAAAGLHSVVAIPLFDSDNVIGVLELFNRSLRPVGDAKALQLGRTGAALGRLIARRSADEERRRLLEMVERKSAEWMSTFDSIELPIFLISCDGKLVRINRAARDLTESDFGELIGRDVRSIGSGEPWATLADVTTAVDESGIGCTAQIEQDERSWDVSASLLAADAADERRVIVALHETTQLMKLQESVRRGEQLASLGELVAGVAHEVKNPIFGMGMTIDLLEQALHDSDSVDMLNALRTWLQRLSALTENLLEYGKTWSIELLPGTIDPVVEQAIEVCRPRALEANVTIECEGTTNGATLLMDGARLSHVFENLVMNAIQFSPRQGSVSVFVAAESDAVDVSVRDRGSGFNPADLPRLWQPLFTRRRGGTGLGLSIVQRIVDEHGGTVTAYNHPDGGAVVWVRFPTYTG